MTHQCALVAATVMASTTAVLAEPAQQPYASLLIGGGFLSEATPSGGVLDDDFVTASDGPFRVGRSAGLSLGYRWDHGFRAELRGDAPAGDTAPTIGPGSAEPALAYRLRANALYDFDLPDSGFIGYFGMSIGLDVPHIMPGGIGVGLATDPRTRVFAYEFLAGADYAILPDVKLGAQYRFLGTSDIDPATHASLASSHGSLNDQSVILTLRYDWGASPVAPAASRVAASTPTRGPRQIAPDFSLQPALWTTAVSFLSFFTVAGFCADWIGGFAGHSSPTSL